MIEIKACPVCKHTQQKEVFKGPYFRGNNELFSVKSCQACGFWFTSPRPEEGEELNSYYETEDYVSHTEQSASLTDKLYLMVRKWALKNKLGIINAVQPNKGQLLDYGAGTGAFLEVAKNNGWQTIGVEPSQVAREQAQKRNIDLVDPNDLSGVAKPAAYSAITLWHVLEHLPNLSESLQNFYNWLKPGGNLIIAVPNHNSHDAKVYGANWAALDLPLHLYHFTQKDIKGLAQKHGFELTSVKNMPFDSFYVSMLSEKIKGKANLPKAFLTGLMSNLKGASSKNMSSLIYVLTKPA